VTLAYFDSEEVAYVTLIGKAKVEKDIHKHWSKWGEKMRTFFPEGPESEDYVMIEFMPSRIEILSFTRDVLPESYVLKPDVLLRTDDGWVIEDTESELEEEFEKS
jgi:general stress protein 26